MTDDFRICEKCKQPFAVTVMEQTRCLSCQVPLNTVVPCESHKIKDGDFGMTFKMRECTACHEPFMSSAANQPKCGPCRASGMPATPKPPLTIIPKIDPPADEGGLTKEEEVVVEVYQLCNDIVNTNINGLSVSHAGITINITRNK